MALHETFASGTPERPRSLHAALSTALAGVSGVYERLGQLADGLAAPGNGKTADSGPRDDPHRETWADLNEAIADGAVVAAFATGLHHRAAAELDDIEHEIASIAALVRNPAARVTTR